MKIPISDLANSACNSSNCEAIVDAATNAITGTADTSEKWNATINAPADLNEKAKPAPELKDLP